MTRSRCTVALVGAIAASACFAAVAAPPKSAPQVKVTREAFCLRRTEQRCEEVALPVEAPIDFNRLPTLEDGRRGIWFYSDQVASGKAVLVHVLEAEDDDAGLEIGQSESVHAGDRDLGPKLRALAKRLGGGGRVSLTPFRLSPASEPVRVFSSLPIDGPGAFSARIATLDGTLEPANTRITINVMQGRVAPSRPAN